MEQNDFIMKVIMSLNKQLSKRQLKSEIKTIDNSMYVRVITKISKTLSKRQLKKDLKELNDLYIKIGADIKIDRNTKSKLQRRIKELQNSIADIEIKTKVAKKNLNAEVDSAKRTIQTRTNKKPVTLNLEIKKNKAIADIEYLAKRFSKLFSNVSAKQKYNNLLNSAYSISDESQLKAVRTQIASFTSELKANDLASKSLGDKWRTLLERSKDLFSAASIVTAIFTQVRKAVTTILELDTAMTNAFKVQNDITSRDQFSGLLTKWNKLAQNLSITTKSLITSMEEWSKIGFNLEMSEKLAQITAIFERTAEISNEKANSTLISVAQAFPEIDGLGEDDYIERVEAIANKINNTGNMFAIDSEGVSDALQNSSAALRMAGNDLDESIAIVTTSNKIYQNPDEVGNMAKVLSARLRGQRGELEALNEDTEGMIESVSKVQTEILNLTHNKVNIFESDNETLKSTYQIISEIGKVYDTLSDKDQAKLLEIIAGKQRMSSVASLLLNYEELEKVKNASMNSDNSMQEEYNRYLESAEAHITTFKEKAIEAYSTFLSGDLIKHISDIGSGILDLVNSTDLLKHSLIAIATIKIGNGIATLGGAIASALKQARTLGSAIQQVKDLPLDGALRKNSLKKIGNSTQNLTEKNLKLLLSQKQLEKSDKIRILKMHGITKQEAASKLEKMGLTTATNVQTSATQANTAANTANSASVNKLKGTFTGLKTSIKAAWSAMSGLEKASIIFATVSTAWSIISSVIDGHNQKVEEAKQKTQELADEVVNEENNLVSLINQYNKLDKTDRSTENTEKIRNLNEQINTSLGAQAENIDLVNGKLDEQSKKLQRNLLQKLKDDKTKIDASVSVAKSEYDEGLEQGTFGIDTWGSVSRTLDEEGATLIDGRLFGGNIGNILESMTPDKQLKQLKEWISLLTEADAGTGKYGDQLAQLQGWYDEVNEKKEKYDKSVEAQKKNEAQQKILEDSLNGKVNSVKAFKEYRNQIKETYKDNENLQTQILEFSNTVFPDYAKGIEAAANKVSDSKNVSVKSFSDIWNDKDYKSTKAKLEKLAKSGKLTPETIKSTEDYKKMWEETGLSAKEFITQIQQVLSMQDKLSMFSKDTKKVTTAYKDFKKNGYVSSGSLNSMPDSFKELDGYAKFNKTVRNKKSSSEQKQSAFNDLISEYLQQYKIFEGIYQKFKDTQDKIDDAKENGNSKAVSKYTKQLEKQQKKYATSLRDAGVTNSDEVINTITRALNKEEELTRKASSELNKLNANDLENYVKTLNKKGELSADSLSKIGSNMQTLVNILGKAYKTDLTNWMNALEEKRKAWNKLASAVGGSTKEETKKNYKKLMNKDESELTAYDMGAYEYTTKAGFSVDKKGKIKSNADKKEKEARKIVDFDLKKIKGKFKVNYHPNTASGDGTKSNSSKEKATEEINWLERALDVLQKKLDVTEAKLQNLFSVSSKNNNLQKQIKHVEKQISAYDKVMQKYNKKMKQADKKNVFYKNEKKNDNIISKIKNGKLSGKNLDDLISTYGEKRGKKIKKYIEYYDNYLDAQKNKEDKKAAKRELKKEQYQNYVELYDDRTARAEAKEAVQTNYADKNNSINTQLENIKKSYEYQKRIANLTGDKAETDKLEYDMQKKIAELKLQQIQNIQKDYDNRIGLIDDDVQDINNDTTLIEALGKIVTANYYKNQNDLQKNKRQEAVVEQDKVRAELASAIKNGSIKMYSDEWYEVQSTLQTLDNTINDCNVEIAKNTSAIREVYDAMLEELAENASRINTEADFLTSLLSRDELTDSEKGIFTDAGLGTLGTYGINMETAQSQIRELNREFAILEEMKKKGKLDYGDGDHIYNSVEQLEEAYDKLIDKQEEWTKNEFDAEQKIIDLMKEYYQAQVDYMKEIIDAKKKVLDYEKDLYNYEKNISEKAKNIATLEKQVAALQGDTSEEGRARLSKIQLSLDEANQDLQDTEYDKYISDQQNMLDNMYEQYEDLMQNLFKDTDKILEDGIRVINENARLIKGILDKKAEDYGYDYSDNFRDILDSFNTNGEVVNGIQYSLNGDESSIASKLDEQNKYIQAKYDYGNSTNGNSSGNGGGTNNNATPKAATTDKITPTVAQGTQTKKGQTVATHQTQEKMSNSFFTEIGTWLSNGHATASTKNVKSDLNKKLKKYWGVALSGKNKDKEFKALAKKLGVSKKVDYTKNGAVYKKLESEIKGFRTGGIVRASGVPSDGDYIPIRVNPNETVLTEKFTDMLPTAVDIMGSFAKAVKLPDYSNFVPKYTSGSQFNGDINVNIDLPNVTDYKSFCTEMQSDPMSRRMFKTLFNECSKNGNIGRKINL